MKHLRYMPIAFVCGVHGFAIFAPYVILMFTAVALTRWIRLAPATIPVS